MIISTFFHSNSLMVNQFQLCPFISVVLQSNSSLLKFGAYCKISFRLCTTGFKLCSFKFVPWHGQRSVLLDDFERHFDEDQAKDEFSFAVMCPITVTEGFEL